jgi:hypothetical protein
MSKAAARTGIMPMAVVAVEQYLPKAQRVIDDGLAARLLPLGAMIFVRFLRPRWMRDWIIGLTEKSDPGIWGGMLCRKRYIDEKLVASRNEIEAMVNLGAGFDTRPYRLPALSNLPVWEVDQRENVEAKEKRLRKALGTIPPNVKLNTGGPWILRGQADIFRLGSGKSIPNRTGCESNLRLARQGCTGQPPCLHLRPQRFLGRQNLLRLGEWLQTCRSSGTESSILASIVESLAWRPRPNGRILAHDFLEGPPRSHSSSAPVLH